MLDLSHIATLLLFIGIGGIGMASMQDGMALIVRRLIKTTMPATRRTLCNRNAEKTQSIMMLD